MANKLVERFNEIDSELNQVRQVVTAQTTDEAVRAQMVDLEAKQTDLKEILQHLISVRMRLSVFLYPDRLISVVVTMISLM